MKLMHQTRIEGNQVINVIDITSAPKKVTPAVLNAIRGVKRVASHVKPNSYTVELQAGANRAIVAAAIENLGYK